MEKKLILIVVSLTPILLGFLYNLLLSAGIAVALVLYLFPILLLAFWFWTGSLFAQRVDSLPLSIVLAHVPGLLSFAVFLWQFWGTVESARDLVLAELSQMFVSSAAFFTIFFAVLFEPEVDVVTKNTLTAMQILGLLFMAVIFILGFTWKKKQLNQK